MISLLDPAASPDLLEESYGGLEHIGTLGKKDFQLSEISKLTLFLKPAVALAPAYQGPVLALHIAVVVFVVWTGTSEGDPTGMAETDEMSMLKLSPVVRMERDDLSWVPVETGLQGGDHIDLCFRPDRHCLGPPGAPVGDRQGPPKVSHRLSSIMTHQVHGQDARNIQGRVHAGLNGDPATQRGAPGMGNSMDTVHVPLCGQKSPDRGRTHLEEEPSCLVIDMEMSMGDEVLRGGGHACCQTDRSQEGACAPDGDQCLLHERAVPGRSVLVDLFRGVSHEDTISQEVSLSCLVHDMGSISPAVSRGLTEVVQHCGLLCLPCFQIYLCLDHREFLPFLEPPLGLD